VKHEERHAGVSNYSVYKLIRLNFDLVTGFSLAPLQIFTMLALLCSAGSLVLVLVLAYGRIFLHDDTNGVFTLFGVLFFLISVAMVGIGLIGEYVGRSYQVLRSRQRYFVKDILETKP
jgi:undecaprenyl-phosphate 4-deoxy-4-formamido-L-arabinose transferase